ncbi:MAG: endonuclease/exonuclease/phosphatase family protein [Opitutales bacterium]|nr:endonuclease/exonuclease/phosphatase family protein [Opitutales bacterium]
MKILALFSFFLLSLSTRLAAVEFNIASFNIRNAPNENANAWPLRKANAKAIIDHYDFDICGLQEAYFHQVKFLAGDNLSFTGVGRDDGKTAGEHAAILFNPKKFQLLDSGTFWFSDTPEKASIGWGASYRRICSWAKFKSVPDKKIFFVFNCHLDHQSRESQEKSVALLLKKLESVAGGAPCILTGDFNLPVSSAILKPLAENKNFKDVVLSPELYGPNFSYHAYMLADKEVNAHAKTSEHIDHIFVPKNMKILKARVITDCVSALPDDMKNPCDNVNERAGRVGFASDHFPILARVRF